jgi:alpha-L-rhamnosidase
MTADVQPRLDPVRVEHHHCAVGIGESAPRLSWTVRTDVAGWLQTGYEVELLATDGAVLTSTGRIDAPESVLVPWPGTPLRSRERRGVRVRVWGSGSGGGSGDGEAGGAWSELVWIEAGLLEPADWVAGAAAPASTITGDPDGAAAHLRREFTLDGDVDSARLYVTAHGLYDLEINGEPVGDDVLAPGWTSYHHRLRYRTHDVTALLRRGANVIGSTLADGWYRGRIGFEGGRTQVYGGRTALIAQLEVRYRDGRTDVVATDAAWRCRLGPVLAASLYDGEKYDARRELPGWSAPGFDDGGWSPVELIEHDPAVLVAPTGPAVRRIETLRPVSVTPAPSGGQLLDFGQNISGRLRIRVRGEAGRTIRLRHAEVLQDGELSLRPLRRAAALDEYTLRGQRPGGGPEVWEPRFTIHGFRYAHLENWPDDGIAGLSAGDVEAVVIHSDLERAGWFECSDPLLERLHENVVWSMRGNFVDVPTDCPQRDERLGWTGDLQVFAPTASFLYDCSGLLTSWLADLALEQRELGTVPHYVPWVPLVFPSMPTAVWGDAAVLVPWAMYRRFGDLELLRAQYPSMAAWVDQVTALAGPDHLWNEGFQFGDWLDPAAPPDRPAEARTDRYLVATAYHAHSTQVLADVAALLDETADHARYAQLATDVRRAFTNEFVTPSGRLSSDAQTAYALALQFDLLATTDQRARAGRRLVELIGEERYRIATGFVGTPLLCDALSSVDATDTAYQLLAQRQCPSWLYPVTMGATTIWERWDSMLPDGSVNPGEMTSFNHYALGAVADWMHRVIGGLQPAAPGYRRIRFAPAPGGGLTRAAARHRTPYGLAAVEWVRTGSELIVIVTVPPNTTAEVRLPDPELSTIEVGSGTHRFSCRVRPASDDPPGPDRMAEPLWPGTETGPVELALPV